ncbi:MAG TPA: FGGY-family carbohydrate kinase [Candidatus Acidoferrum sp.]|nr:FGGY-family carbohydrate kinase [Candidatus Acidoferrum sp.]
MPSAPDQGKARAARARRDGVLLSVDVGTGSARAALFDPQGRVLARASHPIRLERPAPDHAEHSSDDIWRAVCAAVRAARAEARIDSRDALGMSFDATCSLVALGGDDRPASVSVTGDDQWNVIVWLDHRAAAEAEEVTATQHRVLAHVGGAMSPEMEIPKLMWLKRQQPAQWRRYGRLLDLADYLVWRASGVDARSECTLACKWTYLAHERPGWQADFLRKVGLADLKRRARLPDRAKPIGQRVGMLTEAAAAELGLSTDCQVGVGLIDAHAGALGALGPELGGERLDHHIAMIAGTSTCQMALSREPRFVPGVWGPYFGAVAPGLWLNEGGQSASGALLDHLLDWTAEGRALGRRGHDTILGRINELRAREGAAFAGDLHVLPDFHGNRSPLADPKARGVISGLALDGSLDAVARLYYAGAVAIALGNRHILERLGEHGYRIDHLHLTGGHVRNPLLVELYADASGCTVVLGEEEDGVLLGTAMVAAVAAGVYPSLAEAAAAMARAGRIVAPSADAREHFDARYRAYLAMQDHSRALEEIMASRRPARARRSRRAS